jgi:2-dehydro-3-deoxygluconokinase
MFDIEKDNLKRFAGNAFVAMGEVMVRDTPADSERPERTRLVHLSMAGSEYSVAVGLARLGIPSAYITRVPDNPYGRAAQNIARENGVNTDHFIWTARTDLMGRMICELGHTPRQDTVVYQRKYSAASRLDAGMVDWQKALEGTKLFHTSGITFGLASHSNYERNHNHEAFKEAMAHKPADCLVGLDWNYRSTLWPLENARAVMTPVLGDYIDVLITTVYDMAQFYGIDCGRYSARQIMAGESGPFEDDDLGEFAGKIQNKFAVKVVGIPLRHADSLEQHRWESAAVSSDGDFFRTPAIRPMNVTDRLGGGDAWTAGFYYGLITEDFGHASIQKGLLVGDACVRLKHTMMFDLPIIERNEVSALMKEDATGSTVRISR